MAREFNDNPSLLKELAEDEKVVWKGAPEIFPLVTAETKKGLVNRWIICALVAIVVVAFVAYQAIAVESNINAWVIVVVLIIIAYLAVVPMVDRNNVIKKCKYYITDRRVLMDYAEKEIYSLPLAGLKCEIDTAEAGCIHVDLGSCVGVSGKKRRVCAFSPQKDDDGNICGMVLYNIPDDKAVRDIFSA